MNWKRKIFVGATIEFPLNSPNRSPFNIHLSICFCNINTTSVGHAAWHCTTPTDEKKIIEEWFDDIVPHLTLSRRNTMTHRTHNTRHDTHTIHSERFVYLLGWQAILTVDKYVYIVYTLHVVRFNGIDLASKSCNICWVPRNGLINLCHTCASQHNHMPHRLRIESYYWRWRRWWWCQCVFTFIIHPTDQEPTNARQWNLQFIFRTISYRIKNESLRWREVRFNGLQSHLFWNSVVFITFYFVDRIQFSHHRIHALLLLSCWFG